MFTSLRLRAFRIFWILTALTNAGQRAFTPGTSWELYSRTRSSLWVGAAMFATLAPSVFGSPIGGVWADRISRRHLLFLSILSGAGVAAVLAVAITAHARSAPLLLLLSLAFGTTSAVGRVAFNALLPGQVGKADLLNAISLQAVAQRGTELVGPALASPLLVALGAGAVFSLVAVMLAAAACLACAIAPPSPAAVSLSQGLWRPTMDGFAYIRRKPAIRMLLALVGFHCCLTMAYLGILPTFVRVAAVASMASRARATPPDGSRGRPDPRAGALVRALGSPFAGGSFATPCRGRLSTGNGPSRKVGDAGQTGRWAPRADRPRDAAPVGRPRADQNFMGGAARATKVLCRGSLGLPGLYRMAFAPARGNGRAAGAPS